MNKYYARAVLALLAVLTLVILTAVKFTPGGDSLMAGWFGHKPLPLVYTLIPVAVIFGCLIGIIAIVLFVSWLVSQAK